MLQYFGLYSVPFREIFHFEHCISGLIQCIDKNKVRREQIRKRVELQTGQKQRAFLGLFFDARKDKTEVIRKEGVRFHRRCVTEEHLSVISEPGSAYFWSYYTQRLFS